MKKRKQKKLKKIPRLFVNWLTILIFILPIVLTVQWAKGIFGPDGSHEIVKAQSFNARPQDNPDDPLSPFEEPIISVSFDDGWQSSYTNAYPIMQEYGIHATYYILAGTFSDPAYMSEAQVKALIDGGDEISSHTITHPDLIKLNDKDLDHELGGSKSILSSKFNIRNDFASPLGSTDDRTREAIAKYYRSNRNTVADLSDGIDALDANLPDSFNKYDINAFTVRNNTTSDQLKNFVKYAQKTNAWIIITYHQIDNSGTTYSVTPDVFREQMKILDQANIRITPIGQVLDVIDRNNYVPSF